LKDVVVARHRRKSEQTKFQWMKYFILFASFAASAVVLAVYCLPFVAYYQIDSAIIAKDAGKLASHTDFMEMRRNLKTQKGQRVIKTLKKDDGKDPSLVDLAISWSALPSDKAIDEAISTEGFYIVLSGPGADRRKADPIKAPTEMSTYQMIKKLIADASFQYQSVSKFVVSLKDEKGRYVGYFSFVFMRQGINWRLTNVILPVF
jgi:hypothetical protein